MYVSYITNHEWITHRRITYWHIVHTLFDVYLFLEDIRNNMQYTMKLTSEAKHHGFIETSSSNEVSLFPQKDDRNPKHALCEIRSKNILTWLEATIFFEFWNSHSSGLGSTTYFRFGRLTTSRCIGWLLAGVFWRTWWFQNLEGWSFYSHRNWEQQHVSLGKNQLSG